MRILLFFLLISCSNLRLLQDNSKGYNKTYLTKNSPLTLYTPELSSKLKAYCQLINQDFKQRGWGESNCQNYFWQHVRNSFYGTPLVWLQFGEEKNLAKKNITLILCGVHGDEITPIKFCFDIITDLQNSKRNFKDKLVIIAPIVNPDSYFKENPSRTNARGVDVNRNFPTKDWEKDALRLWKSRYKKDPRRFPGHRPLSEQATLFQVNLIKRYKPNKIISVHAPLTILDYDGPTKDKGPGPKELLLAMSEKAQGYRVYNYPHFPGSLGNWAGNEREIPTYTLELPNTNPQEHQRFWHLFKEAIYSAIDHSMVEASVEILPSTVELPE